MSPTEFLYRQVAAAGSDGMSLMLALYDTLAGDLQRGAEAERRNDIAERSRQLNHALLVVGFLENQLNKGADGGLNQSLIAFYRRLRRRVLDSQLKRSPEILEQEMAQVLKIRTTWQKLGTRSEPVAAYLPPVARQAYPGSASLSQVRNSKSWSA
jgi:flagellin-specific chaperone FliS